MDLRTTKKSNPHHAHRIDRWVNGTAAHHHLKCFNARVPPSAAPHTHNSKQFNPHIFRDLYRPIDTDTSCTQLGYDALQLQMRGNRLDTRFDQVSDTACQASTSLAWCGCVSGFSPVRPMVMTHPPGLLGCWVARTSGDTIPRHPSSGLTVAVLYDLVYLAPRKALHWPRFYFFCVRIILHETDYSRGLDSGAHGTRFTLGPALN